MSNTPIADGLRAIVNAKRAAVAAAGGDLAACDARMAGFVARQLLVLWETRALARIQAGVRAQLARRAELARLDAESWGYVGNEHDSLPTGEPTGVDEYAELMFNWNGGE